MSSPFKTCWANPWVRRPLLVALTLAVALGGVWYVLDQLGKEAWRALVKQLAAEGETTNFPTLFSPPVPDAENFCAIGPLRNLAADDKDPTAAGEEGRANRARIEGLMKVRPSQHSMHGLNKGTPLDFAVVAKDMRKAGSWPMPAEPGDVVRDVHAGLARWDPFIAELAAGLGRPRAQWMPALSGRPQARPYVAMPKPQLSSVLYLGQSLALRAAVAGRAGDLPKAIEALRIAARLPEASFDEPLLLDALVANLVQSLAAHALWELAWAQQGTAEQWTQLEQVITATDLRGAWLHCYRGELAAQADAVCLAGETRRTTDLVSLLPGMHGFPGDADGPLEELELIGLRVAPPGFFGSLATELVSDQLAQVVQPLRDEGWPALVQKHRALKTRAAPLWNLPARMMRLDEGVVARTMLHGVYLQVQIDEAAIACVLERARLSAGDYPASLDGLTLADGRPLPLDACTGAPMHYRQSPDGRYVLWSEGPDGRDDHATRGAGAALPAGSEYEGDWVWGFSP